MSISPVYFLRTLVDPCGPSLSENIDVSGLDKSYDEYLTSLVDTQFSITPISENKTLKIIKNLRK